MDNAAASAVGAILLGIAGLITAIFRIRAGQDRLRLLERLGAILKEMPDDSLARKDLEQARLFLAQRVRLEVSGPYTSTRRYIFFSYVLAGTVVGLVILDSIIPLTPSLAFIHFTIHLFAPGLVLMMVLLMVAATIQLVIIELKSRKRNDNDSTNSNTAGGPASGGATVGSIS